MRKIAIVLAVIGSFGVTAAPSASFAADRVVDVNANAGKAVRASYYWRIQGCNKSVKTNVKVIKKPKNGKVVIQNWEGVMSSKESKEDFASCGAIKLYGKEVIYVPNAGYKGLDSFEVRRTDNRSSRPMKRTYEYNVRIK